MSMRVTMRENRRSEDGLSILLTGNIYTVSDDYGRMLVFTRGNLDTDNAIATQAALNRNQLLTSEVRTLRLGVPEVNHIGQPGTPYFGVGVCPSIPPNYTPIAVYGNYVFSDGSVMVWIPAFYYRFGHVDNPTYSQWLLNSVDVAPITAFADLQAANAAGYALPRAFYNAGAVQPGFFVDKYGCSNNAGVASSIRLGNPLSSAAVHNPFSALTGAPANNYGGAFAAAKTRGARFFPVMRYQRVALAMLSMAQAQASHSAADCAWWDGSTTGLAGPKGNNNTALRDANDGAVAFVGDGYSACAKAGSGVPFAKTTHNGQDSGIADLNGNMWEVTPGVTYHSGSFYSLNTGYDAAALTGGNTLATDAWGAAGVAAHSSVLSGSLIFGSGDQRYGNGANRVFSAATSGASWVAANLGFVDSASSVSSPGINAFGQDYYYDANAAPNELCPIAGGHWTGGSTAGVWAVGGNNARSNSGDNVGVRAASYL